MRSLTGGSWVPGVYGSELGFVAIAMLGMPANRMISITLMTWPWGTCSSALMTSEGSDRFVEGLPAAFPVPIVRCGLCCSRAPLHG